MLVHYYSNFYYILQDDLKALEGTKCRAPHGSSWGGTGYHNAMVCSVFKNDDELSSLNDILVCILTYNFYI